MNFYDLIARVLVFGASLEMKALLFKKCLGFGLRRISTFGGCLWEQFCNVWYMSFNTKMSRSFTPNPIPFEKNHIGLYSNICVSDFNL